MLFPGCSSFRVHPFSSVKSCVFSPDSLSCVSTGRVGRIELRLAIEFKLGKQRNEGKRGLRDK